VGNITATFTGPRQFAQFIAINGPGGLVWQIVANDNAVLS
jgi:hypothetical protein